MDIYDTAWDSLKNYIKNDKNLILRDELKSDFISKADTLHSEVIGEYMKPKRPDSNDKLQLDRHKLAAVSAICLSKGDYVGYKADSLKDNDILLGRYLAAIYVACSLVAEDMNNDLKKSRLTDKNEKIPLCLPDPVICDTKSANTLARMLIWEERKKVDDCIRVLELANTLFLIEQYTLLINDIDMGKWKEYQKEQHK